MNLEILFLGMRRVDGMEYIVVKESELSNKKYAPLQVAFLMIRFGDAYLLKRDFEGGHWELPATGINTNETPRECIIRNYSDKYGLNDFDVKLIGVSKVVFEKTEWRPDPKPEYLVLFEAIIDNKDDVFNNIDENLHLWYVFEDDINPYCQLCRRLIEYHEALME